nr:MAG TPA: hypothetical protein [Caudoviricetes sp.]
MSAIAYLLHTTRLKKPVYGHSHYFVLKLTVYPIHLDS